jgi:hypothetical protein
VFERSEIMSMNNGTQILELAKSLEDLEGMKDAIGLMLKDN